MRKHTKQLITIMLALVMACALAVPVFAFSTDIDYTTPTGKWTAILEGAYPLVNGYEDPPTRRSSSFRTTATAPA